MRFLFSSCFGFDSALNTIDAQMFFWLVFFKTHKKIVIDHQKHHFGSFWRLIMVFLCVLNNIDQDNICVSIVLKAKTEKKIAQNVLTSQKRAFLSFEIKTLKNTDQKNICAFIVFKAESKLKHKEFFCLSSKTKNALFWGSKVVLLKSQISNLYF